jgi:hypothetical protein
MKKIFKYLGIVLSVALMGAFTACQVEKENESADLGLGIKVFFPTKVVAGQPMTINGSGFSDVREIVFPGDVSVTGFELVSDEMIRVVAPAGISSDGGKIYVVSSTDKAESRMPLTLGNTVISGFSKQDGEEIEGGQQLTIYGEDLEFITGVELLNADGEPEITGDELFYRKGTSSVIINIPKKVFEGTYIGTLYTYDGKQFSLPELSYKPASDGGHWEIVREIIWENDGSHGAINWSGDYRFAGEGHETGEEIYSFPADQWARLKSETFYVLLEGRSPQIRITTGWWSTNWTVDDIFPGNELLTDNDDGTYILEVNLSGAQALLDLLDDQHMLLTGSGYTPLAIYFEKEEWVEGGGHEEIVKTSIWKNDGSHGAINWSGDYRFAGEGHETGEEIYSVPADQWAKLKSETFYVLLEGGSPQIRITTGWWTTTWTVDDIFPGNELLTDNGDGTYVLEVNLSGAQALLDLLDVQHLLLTGSGYTPLELYFEETIWVEGDGDTPQEVDIWENDGSHGAINWGGDYRFAPESNSTGEEIYTVPQDVWDKMKTGTFYLEAAIATPDWYNMRITTGWWTATWTGADIGKGDERIILSDDGTTFKLEINFDGDPILDVLDAQHLLFTGEGYTPLRLYLIE